MPSATSPRRSSRIHAAATGMPKGREAAALERSGSGSPDPRVGGAQATAPSRKARSPAVTGPRTTTARWHRVREVPAELTSRPRRVSVPLRFRRTATTRSVARSDGCLCSTRDKSGPQARRWALSRPWCDPMPSECSDQRRREQRGIREGGTDPRCTTQISPDRRPVSRPVPALMHCCGPDLRGPRCRNIFDGLTGCRPAGRCIVAYRSPESVRVRAKQ